MRVSLLSCTPDALDLLLYTKNTRLTMSPEGLQEVAQWSDERKAKELAYMRNTIQSSWEFVDYVFAIEGVTRAFTHQLVRHRVGTSFAQQTQRGLDVSEGFDYLATGATAWSGQAEAHNTKTVHDADIEEVAVFDQHIPLMYEAGMQTIQSVYEHMIEAGGKPQDVRGILPTNILTNIVFKANLRTLHDMALKRLCVKAQGEFQDVFAAIIAAVVAQHPWAADFLKVQCAWNGTCLFPSVTVDQCHVKARVYNPVTGNSYGYDAGDLDSRPATTDVLYHLHRLQRGEIQPVLNGKASHGQ